MFQRLLFKAKPVKPSMALKLILVTINKNLIKTKCKFFDTISPFRGPDQFEFKASLNSLEIINLFMGLVSFASKRERGVKGEGVLGVVIRAIGVEDWEGWDSATLRVA